MNYDDNHPGNCGAEILNILMKFGGGVAMINTHTYRLDVGIELFRTRKMDYKSAKNIKSLSELYSPPAENTPWGRLNEINKPILYASFKEDVAVAENPSINDYFILIKYKVIKELELLIIGTLLDGVSTHPNDKKHQLYNVVNNFVKNLMLEKNESQSYYIFTNGIIQRVYDNLVKNNGYLYNSAVLIDEYNIAIKKEFEKKLEVTEVWFCKLKKNNQIKRIKKINKKIRLNSNLKKHQ